MWVCENCHYAHAFLFNTDMKKTNIVNNIINKQQLLGVQIWKGLCLPCLNWSCGSGVLD